MRKIKFRAWDTDNNRFVDCSSHLTSQISNEYSGLGNRFIYQQFTGLQDKNGKDIYEGDILKIKFEGVGDEFIISIRWDITGANWQFDDYTSFDDGVGLGEWDFTMGIAKHSEIVGNIYENSELLK